MDLQDFFSLSDDIQFAHGQPELSTRFMNTCLCSSFKLRCGYFYFGKHTWLLSFPQKTLSGPFRLHYNLISGDYPDRRCFIIITSINDYRMQIQSNSRSPPLSSFPMHYTALLLTVFTLFLAGNVSAAPTRCKYNSCGTNYNVWGGNPNQADS